MNGNGAELNGGHLVAYASRNFGLTCMERWCKGALDSARRHAGSAGAIAVSLDREA